MKPFCSLIFIQCIQSFNELWANRRVEYILEISLVFLSYYYQILKWAILFHINRLDKYEKDDKYRLHTSRQTSSQTRSYLHCIVYLYLVIINKDTFITANLHQNLRRNVSYRITNENMHKMIKWYVI